MIPVLFPFTFISDSELKSLGSVLGPTAVYQPSAQTVPASLKRWGDEHLLKIRIPITGEEDRLMAALRTYRTWAQLESPAHRSRFKFVARSKADTEEAASRIQSEILRGAGGKEKEKPPDPGFQARFFLLMAQDWDVQQSELNRELVSLERMEHDFHDLLHGQDRLEPTPRPDRNRLLPTDFTDFMVPERMTAWSRLMLQDPEPASVFVTPNRQAYELALAHAPEAEPILHCRSREASNAQTETGSRGVDSLKSFLETLAREPWSPDRHRPCEPMPQGALGLTLSIVPNIPPQILFGRMVKDPPQPSGVRDPIRHTLIGLIPHSG